MKFIDRKIERTILAKFISLFPVTAILGPRQCGKTTLARTLEADAYFDLENPQDLARLEQPQLALEDLTGLIVIDEIQRLPDLFPLLRYLVDQGKSRLYSIGWVPPQRLRSRGYQDPLVAGGIATILPGGVRG
jgi:predicted AAA+ superfamily ATPase